MSRLFEATMIKGMSLPNRFVRSATWEGMAAEDGACTPQLLNLMVQLAQGQVGLIISSYAYVMRDGKTRIGQLGIYKDELIEGLRQVTTAVHDQGSKIAAQIVHAGTFSDAKFTGQIPLGPSRVADLVASPHEAMSIEDIRVVVEAFGRAAYRVKMAGFDAVQIHAAHGYLLSQFLSPALNKRTDRYGGTIQNRARALLEVLRAVRAAAGADFPVLMKMNCQDFLDGGLTMEDAVQAATMLQEEGLAALELSGGTVISGDLGPARPGITSQDKEAYFKEAARAFKKDLHIPLILVGGIRSFQLAEQLVEDGHADYISMSRPFIREPALIARWALGDRRKATCVSDNLCRGPAFSGEGIYCVVEKRRRDRKDQCTSPPGRAQ